MSRSDWEDPPWMSVAPAHGLGSQTEENGERELSTSIYLSLGPECSYNMTPCVGDTAQSGHLVNHGHSVPLSPTQGVARDSGLSKATYLLYSLG